jgi:hypothetical protein
LRQRPPRLLDHPLEGLDALFQLVDALRVHVAHLQRPAVLVPSREAECEREEGGVGGGGANYLSEVVDLGKVMQGVAILFLRRRKQDANFALVAAKVDVSALAVHCPDI